MKFKKFIIVNTRTTDDQSIKIVSRVQGIGKDLQHNKE